jgi:hypothetical protein
VRICVQHINGELGNLVLDRDHPQFLRPDLHR